MSENIYQVTKLIPDADDNFCGGNFWLEKIIPNVLRLSGEIYIVINLDYMVSLYYVSRRFNS